MMNKAERVYQLIKREFPRIAAEINMSDLVRLCELKHCESPKAIALQIVGYYNS